MWTCPKCASRVDDTYDVCWHCGTSPGGGEDPGFVPADEAEPIAGSPLFSGFSDAMQSEKSFAAGSADLVECYWARDTMEAEHIAARLSEAGIPAVADTQDVRLRGAGAAITNPLAVGNPYFGPRVRVHRENLASARAWLEADKSK